MPPQCFCCCGEANVSRWPLPMFHIMHKKLRPTMATWGTSVLQHAVIHLQQQQCYITIGYLSSSSKVSRLHTLLVAKQEAQLYWLYCAVDGCPVHALLAGHYTGTHTSRQLQFNGCPTSCNLLLGCIDLRGLLAHSYSHLVKLTHAVPPLLWLADTLCWQYSLASCRASAAAESTIAAFLQQLVYFRLFPEWE